MIRTKHRPRVRGSSSARRDLRHALESLEARPLLSAAVLDPAPAPDAGPTPALVATTTTATTGGALDLVQQIQAMLDQRASATQGDTTRTVVVLVRDEASPFGSILLVVTRTDRSSSSAPAAAPGRGSLDSDSSIPTAATSPTTTTTNATTIALDALAAAATTPTTTIASTVSDDGESTGSSEVAASSELGAPEPGATPSEVVQAARVGDTGTITLRPGRFATSTTSVRRNEPAPTGGREVETERNNEGAGEGDDGNATPDAIERAPRVLPDVPPSLWDAALEEESPVLTQHDLDAPGLEAPNPDRGEPVPLEPATAAAGVSAGAVVALAATAFARHRSRTWRRRSGRLAWIAEVDPMTAR